MELTKEAIEKRINELEESRTKLIAQVNAINGAIQVLQEIIKGE